MNIDRIGRLAAIVLMAAFALPVRAQSSDLQGNGLDEVVQRNADVRSEGVRMSAKLYYPKALEGNALPTIIMSHGWGGTAAMLRGQATAFAAAGYFVIAFDYRGWGESDSKVILARPAPEASQKNGQRFTAEVLELREMVDPLDQAEDIFNVIHWAMGERMVDVTRIGLWGTSFSGGLIVYVAARDPRVKALVSQVGYMGQPIDRFSAPGLSAAYTSGTARARGELSYPAPRAREIGNLQGAPIREKFLRYAPVEDVSKVKGCAMLFIAAENEELFDNKQHAALAFQRAAEPKRYVVIPNISHYGIYGEAHEQATRLAIEWFDEHLKH
ncbi:MAG TPA: alpha/beta fold hydrolase [Burkholderiales bacterium]|nr:alpha/beta fold hydrolase [Burkholderiales bacterium]